MIRIQIDPAQIDEAASEFELMPRRVEAALRRAVAKTTRWASRQGARDVAKILKVPARVIMGRSKAFLPSRGKPFGIIFFGRNPLSIGRLCPKRSRTGMRAAGRQFVGAFQPGAGWPVFRRTGPGRLPVEKVVLPMGDEAGAALEALQRQIPARLLADFERELQWEQRKQST